MDAASNAVLLLSKRFSLDGENPWLVDELADEFRRRGFSVDVILIDLSGNWPTGEMIVRNGIRVLSCAVVGNSSFFRSLGFLAAYARVLRICVSGALRPNYALVIGFSIAAVFHRVVRVLKFRSRVERSLLFLWDFFPIHQKEIGKLRSNLLCSILRSVEGSNIRDFDYVALMSPKNQDFFQKYHPGYRGQTIVIPVWGVAAAKRTGRDSSGFPAGKLNIVFGGQITAGRGVDEIVELAELIDQSEIPAAIHVFGAGDRAGWLKRVISERGLRSIEYVGSVSRDQYRQALSSADVGLVATVAGVTVPTFPSKVIDYLAQGVPVLACVESATDFGSIIAVEAQSGIAVEAGNGSKLLAAVERLVELKSKGMLEQLGQNGKRYFLNNMEVGVVVEKIIREVSTLENGR